KLKQALERENRGIFESFFGSKKGKFTTVAVILGAVLVIGGVIFAIVMSSKKKSGSSGTTTVIASAPQPAPISAPQTPRVQIPIQTDATVQVPLQRTDSTLQVPLNGTVQIPLSSLTNVSINGNGRVTGRLYTQNSRQPT